MPNPVLEEIGQFLVDKGHGTLGASTDYGIFLGIYPNLPDGMIAVFELPGDAPEMLLADSLGWESFRFSIYVRAVDYDIARAKISALRSDLILVANQTIAAGSATYLTIDALDTPTTLNRDQKQRETLVAMFHAKRLPT